jgi:hypothetical protein
MSPHHQSNAEGAADIGIGVLCSIGAAMFQYAEPLIYGMLGAIGSIAVRIIYKKYFKKYFE